MPSAARAGDRTNHGGLVVGPGVPTVLVGGRPAAVLGERTTCPVGLPPRQHGSPVITSGSRTVLLAGRPAVRAGDATGCGAVVVDGCPTVLIGG